MREFRIHEMATFPKHSQSISAADELSDTSIDFTHDIVGEAVMHGKQRNGRVDASRRLQTFSVRNSPYVSFERRAPSRVVAYERLYHRPQIARLLRERKLRRHHVAPLQGSRFLEFIYCKSFMVRAP